ncbi:MAG: hypothetical protein GF331_02760 [Chitinivibrionales bacterium]|nr:hypothetical protein [Chitinivibrionales bacterium]
MLRFGAVFAVFSFARRSFAAFVPLCGLLLLGSGCALVRMSNSPPVRTVRVRVVADSGFAENTVWKTNAQTLIDAASDHFTSWFNIALAIDTMQIWDFTQSDCYDSMFEWDCLSNAVGPGSSDIVVLFTKASSRHDFTIAGFGQYETGCIRVAQADWHHVRGGFEYAFLTLIHELGHLFGAFHVFHDDVRKEHHVMNPALSHKLLTKKGTETELLVPEWHPANRTIVRALLHRPFHDSDWNAGHWPAIERAYQQVRREFIGFAVDERGQVVRHALNALSQTEYFYYLSSWAAMCGMDSCALLYVDSLATVLRAIEATCRNCGSNCQARMCLHMGYRFGRSADWLDNRLAYYHLKKAHILLSVAEDDAEEEYETFVELLPKMSAAHKRKFRAAFELHHDRIRARQDDTQTAPAKGGIP